MDSELGPLSLKVNIRKWKKSASEKENTFLLEEIRLYYKFNLLISNSFLSVCFWVLTWACMYNQAWFALKWMKQPKTHSPQWE